MEEERDGTCNSGGVKSDEKNEDQRQLGCAEQLSASVSKKRTNLHDVRDEGKDSSVDNGAEL